MRLLCLTVALGAVVQAADAVEGPPAPPAKDHAIYCQPRPYGLTIVRRRQSELNRLAARHGTPDPASNLVWSLKLTKDKYYVGETIWGRLTLENKEEKFAYKLSPPYHGQIVSTISLWVTRRVEPAFGQPATWTELKEVYWVNKGTFAPSFGYRGRPIVIAPGGKYEAWLPVNVAQCQRQSEIVKGVWHQKCTWLPGVGFSTPGKHRFYLRYFNLEMLSDQLYEDLYEGALAQTADPDYVRATRGREVYVVDLEPEAIVLGPFDVEILALPREPEAVVDRGEALTRLVRQFEWFSSRPANNGATLMHPPGMEFLPALLWRLGPEWRELRLSMEFALLRVWPQFPFEIRFANSDMEENLSDDDKRYRFLRDLAALLSNLKADDPLREHVEFMRCYLLYSVGREQEALELARRLNSPDAQAFLDDVALSRARAARTAQDKKGK